MPVRAGVSIGEGCRRCSLNEAYLWQTRGANCPRGQFM